MTLSKSQRRAEILGVPIGTAANKLRKMIMFSLLDELGKNQCFVCKQVIKNADELSIEHIEPWESTKDASKFWDLNNIAFSHLRCNRPHKMTDGVNSGLARRKIGPEGTSWCMCCQVFLPISEFYQSKTRWRGLSAACRKCESQRNAKYYKRRRSLATLI